LNDSSCQHDLKEVLAVDNVLQVILEIALFQGLKLDQQSTP